MAVTGWQGKENAATATPMSPRSTIGISTLLLAGHAAFAFFGGPFVKGGLCQYIDSGLGAMFLFLPTLLACLVAWSASAWLTMRFARRHRASRLPAARCLLLVLALAHAVELGWVVRTTHVLVSSHGFHAREAARGRSYRSSPAEKLCHTQVDGTHLAPVTGSDD